MKHFDTEYNKIIEGFNVYPRSKIVQGRMPPMPSTNVNSVGPMPVGFKGAGPTGIAPSTTATVLLPVPKKKKKRIKKN